MTTLAHNPLKNQRKARYAPADAVSELLSERAEAIASWIIRRGNRRRAAGFGDSLFESRYEAIVELARRKYPLAKSTIPTWALNKNPRTGLERMGIAGTGL